MAYSPTTFVGDPNNPDDILSYLEDELLSISGEMSETQALESRTVHAEPKKPREGMIVIADGTDWDPGSGAGAYVYQGGGWVWLGLQASDIDLTPFLQKASNLSDVANVTTSQQNLGVEVGVDVQAFDAQLHSNIPLNTQSNDYTLVLTDGEKGICNFDTVTPHTWTIPDNGSVAFPSGTAITFFNFGTTITIAITTDSLVFMGSGAGATGSRTLAQYGQVTIVKIGSTLWTISGAGLT